MLRLVLAALLTMSASAALALSRVDTAGITCASVQKIIAKQGEVILRHPSPATGTLVYYQYVRNDSSCDGRGKAVRAFIATKDLMRCPVARCVQYTTRGGH